MRCREGYIWKSVSGSHLLNTSCATRQSRAGGAILSSEIRCSDTTRTVRHTKWRSLSLRRYCARSMDTKFIDLCRFLIRSLQICMTGIGCLSSCVMIPTTSRVIISLQILDSWLKYRVWRSGVATLRLWGIQEPV